MTFNSLSFVVFFLVFYVFYIGVHKKIGIRNVLLLAASYFFYGWWDWRFLTLIWCSTLCDYYISLKISSLPNVECNKGKRKLFLLISVIFNIGVLATFKYLNFFVESFIDLLSFFHLQADFTTISIILPLGISFYTFQTLSYTIDVFRDQLKPTTNLLDFSLYVAFFPQLVAGPIERAAKLLPQIRNFRPITAELIETGVFLIIIGFYKKVVIADNLGIVADRIFNNYGDYYGFDLLVGIIAFSLQIYCDFSGYSDIARGIARLMGFDLMLNFNLPYFSLSPKEFWHRWHISLSTWFKDYIYIPLGGNRMGGLQVARNLMLTMLICGLWHGAGWNFILWGGYHGTLLVAYYNWEKISCKFDWVWPVKLVGILVKWVCTTSFVLVGWVIFRSETMQQCITILSGIPKYSFTLGQNTWISILIYLVPLILIEMLQYYKNDLLVIPKLKSYILIPIYTYFIVAIFIFGVRGEAEFIYFRF